MQSGGMIAPVTTIPRAAPNWTPPEPPTSETREQLLAAAERLFAERGFAGVSVRVIAAEAGVNWSLVGYYFRGKDGLLAEVYRRHCTTLNRERLRMLTEARRTGLQLESVIEAFVRPALTEIQGAMATMMTPACARCWPPKTLRSLHSSWPTISTSPAARSSLRSASACRTSPRMTSCGDSTSCWGRSTTPQAARSASRRFRAAAAIPARSRRRCGTWCRSSLRRSAVPVTARHPARPRPRGSASAQRKARRRQDVKRADGVRD